ncbi:MAG: uroporphyrinogen-III synthase [Leptothrix ochracea]|uniref:uroporphyrinogen-III synthase n=1 Tax=Leptothrix ochracea TaxID=735331 RepID=UPI0034E1A93B
MPPAGRFVTLVVTRPQPQADAWVARLHALQQPAMALPLLRIEGAPAHAHLAAEAWRTLAAHRLVMFVSPNAVAQFFQRRPAGASWPELTLAGATGMGTVAALQAHGVPQARIAAPSPQSPQFDAEALWTQVLVSLHWAGQRVLIVRGEAGRDWLTETLQQHGADVHALCAYQRLGPVWDAAASALVAQLAANPGRHAWLFSSSEAIRHLMQHVLHATSRASDDLAGVRAAMVVATHERIAQTALEHGFSAVRLSVPDPAQIIHALHADRDTPP